MPVTHVTTDTFTTVVLQSPVPVIIDFWAPWCGPCRSIGPALEALAEKRGDTVRICKVNVDEEPALAQAFRVQSIPLVVGMKGSSVVASDVGWKGPQALEALVDQTIAATPPAEPVAAIKEVDVQALRAALAAGGAVVDVREPHETAAGHVPGAILIPLGELHARVGELGKYTGKELFVICKGGARSMKAAEFLVTQGFKPVNVAGGTMAWIGAGLAIES